LFRTLLCVQNYIILSYIIKWYIAYIVSGKSKEEWVAKTARVIKSWMTRKNYIIYKIKALLRILKNLLLCCYRLGFIGEWKEKFKCIYNRYVLSECYTRCNKLKWNKRILCFTSTYCISSGSAGINNRSNIFLVILCLHTFKSFFFLSAIRGSRSNVLYMCIIRLPYACQLTHMGLRNVSVNINYM